MEDKNFEKGYDAALEDVQAAMAQSHVSTLGPQGYQAFDDPAVWIPKLKELRSKRFATNSNARTAPTTDTTEAPPTN